MITFSFIFLFLTTSTFSQEQSCDCKADLDFIVEKLEKMPSYRKQIKGEKSIQFENTYKELSQKMVSPIEIEECYRMLLKQMSFINDVHASLQINMEYNLTTYKPKMLYSNNSNKIKSLNDTEAELRLKDNLDKEGVYTFKNEKIGIQYIGKSKRMIGFVIKSSLKNWDAGEIRFILYPEGENKYNMYYYKIENKTPAFVKSLSFENGRIWSYKKVGNENNFELLTKRIEVAEFRQLNAKTQYLYFKTFSNSKKNELIKFYDETSGKLTAPNIIVDLRSNNGGNKKYSDSFLKLLKNKNVYVITNCFTSSNGEQFTLKLLKNKNAKHLGQTTRGIIAYGKNYGYKYTTPSGYFKITPTDMNFHRYIEFEGKGITPEIRLDFDKDWITQTLELIDKKNKN